MILKRITTYVTLGFSCIWAFLIIIDYLYFHPSYIDAVNTFDFTNLFVLLVGGMIGYVLIKKNATRNSCKFILNGLGVLLLFSIICGCIIPTQFYQLFPFNKSLLALTDVIIFIGKIFAVLLANYFIYIICFVSGSTMLSRLFNLPLNKLEHTLVSLASGIILISILLFIVAFFNMLNAYILLPLFAFILILGRKSVFQFIKQTLFIPFIQRKKINWLGFGSLYVLLIFVSLNYISNIRPIPLGSDALRVYLNIPKLMLEHQGLIDGYSPYYWSLFISLGHILFNSTEIVIGLSMSGGILSILTLYAISRNWFDQDYSLFIGLILYTIPMVNFLSHKDIKDDLGLLFISLIVVLLIVKFLIFPFIEKKKINYHSKQTNVSLFNNTIDSETQYVILIGFLSGGTLGIKLTSLILIFSIIALLFFYKSGIIGFLVSIILTFFFILMANLDVASGLRSYHLGVHWFRWVILVFGLIGLAYMFFKDKSKTINLFKLCTIYGVVIFLTYLPWPIKNYTELKTISIQIFITGQKEIMPIIE